MCQLIMSPIVGGKEDNTGMDGDKGVEMLGCLYFGIWFYNDQSSAVIELRVLWLLSTN